MTEENNEQIASGDEPANESMEPDDARKHWLEIAAAIMLSLAVVGAAWAGYQSARWGGEQATANADANGVRLESARAQTRGGQLLQIDVALFFQAVNAFAADDERRLTFYTERFREEFKPIFDQWMALDPGNNPDAPLSPFDLDEYQVAELEEAVVLQERADELVAISADARGNAENYTVALVLFAIAIFFASIASRFASFRTQVALVSFGIVLFVAVATWLGTLPKSVAL